MLPADRLPKDERPPKDEPQIPTPTIITATGKAVARSTTTEGEYLAVVEYTRDSDRAVLLCRDHRLTSAGSLDDIDAQLASLKAAEDDARLSVDIVGKVLGRI